LNTRNDRQHQAVVRVEKTIKQQNQEIVRLEKTINYIHEDYAKELDELGMAFEDSKNMLSHCEGGWGGDGSELSRSLRLRFDPSLMNFGPEIETCVDYD